MPEVAAADLSAGALDQHNDRAYIAEAATSAEIFRATSRRLESQAAKPNKPVPTNAKLQFAGSGTALSDDVRPNFESMSSNSALSTSAVGWIPSKKKYPAQSDWELAAMQETSVLNGGSPTLDGSVSAVLKKSMRLYCSRVVDESRDSPARSAFR